MTDHASTKRLAVALLTGLAVAEPDDIAGVVARYCHPDCRWEIFCPFDTLLGIDAAVEHFWRPLRAAFPDYEQRIGLMLAGTYEGREQVSSLGHLIGTFAAPWLGIPATWAMTFLRFGFHGNVAGGKFAKIYILLDVVDVMRQAGVYPFRRMPGSPEQWPLPPCDTGATTLAADLASGARTLQIVHEMQMGLPPGGKPLTPEQLNDRHSPHWHANMNWYGPAGIGSARGRRGFRDYHGALWLQAFADRTGFPRQPGGPEDAPGHFIRLGDGNYAVTSGWPSLHGTHVGGEWLGLPPTGRPIRMRVADWYRIDGDGKIIDNWVMIDVPDMVRQMGMDIFHDLQFRVDPGKERWPSPAPDQA